MQGINDLWTFVPVSAPGWQVFDRSGLARGRLMDPGLRWGDALDRHSAKAGIQL
jgi:hypothetical protein